MRGGVFLFLYLALVGAEPYAEEDDVVVLDDGNFDDFLRSSPIALVEFSKRSRKSCVETFAYAHIEVGLKI